MYHNQDARVAALKTQTVVGSNVKGELQKAVRRFVVVGTLDLDVEVFVPGWGRAGGTLADDQIYVIYIDPTVFNTVSCSGSNGRNVCSAEFLLLDCRR
jgi:hypothetical protein